ncbi:hypothetical protein BGZ94_007225 [Podila epigama]|nr:hypothetical protein BGZ94_007225 [Podila epigama]
MLALVLYSVSSVALSVIIANANGPVMDVSQFVKPTATISWADAARATLAQPTPPSVVQPSSPSTFSRYLEAIVNSFSTKPSSSSSTTAAPFLSSWSWISLQKRSTSQNARSFKTRISSTASQPLRPIRGGPSSPRADTHYHPGHSYHDYEHDTRSFNKSGFCATEMDPSTQEHSQEHTQEDTQAHTQGRTQEHTQAHTKQDTQEERIQILEQAKTFEHTHALEQAQGPLLPHDDDSGNNLLGRIPLPFSNP